MSRPPITPRAVEAAMAAIAEAREEPGLAGSLRLRAHAAEAVLLAFPELGAERALALAGVAGDDGALRVAAEMSGDGWSPRLAEAIARLLRMLGPAGRAVDRPPGGLDLTSALMGDPGPAHAAGTLCQVDAAHG